MGEEARSGGGRPQAQTRRLVALGAGLYWAAFLVMYTHGETSASTSQFFVLLPLASTSPRSFAFYFVMIAVLAAATVGARRLSSSGGLRLLAAGSIVGAVAQLGVLWVPAASAGAAAIALSAVYGAGNACTILFWGLNFTCLEKHDAEWTTTTALSIALAFYLVLSALPLNASATTTLAFVMVIISSIPYLAGRYQLVPAHREDSSPSRKVLAPFYASRAVYGLCFGAVSFLCVSVAADAAVSAVFSLVAFALLAAYCLHRIRSSRTDLALLRLAPLIACCLIAWPFVPESTFDALTTTCAVAFIWMGWSILHSVQLSAMKEAAGLGDCALSFSEKLVFVLFTALGKDALALCSLAFPTIGGDHQATISAILVVLALTTIAFCYQLSRVVDTKEAARVVDNAIALNEQRNEPVLEKIAADFGLTAREADVMRLLAKGYSRSSICEELCISEGTVRTHVMHIYKKMDIHSRDELLDLVERTTRDYVAR